MTAITPDLYSIGVVAEMTSPTEIIFFVLPPVNTTEYKTTLHRLSLYLIVFNNGYFNQAGFATWSSDTLKFRNQTAGSYTNTSFYDQSALLGLRWFSFKGVARWNMGVTFVNNSQVDFTTINNPSFFGYDFLIMQTFFCPFATPYLD